MRWRYANASETNRTGVLSIDGSRVSTEDFVSTDSWSSWNTTSVKLNVAAGDKALRLEANQAEGLANIDYIEVTGPNVTSRCCD